MAYDSRAIAKLLQDEKHKEYFPVDYPLFYMTRQVSNSDSIDGTDNESKEGEEEYEELDEEAFLSQLPSKGGHHMN